MGVASALSHLGRETLPHSGLGSHRQLGKNGKKVKRTRSDAKGVDQRREFLALASLPLLEQSACGRLRLGALVLKYSLSPSLLNANTGRYS